MCPQQHQRGSGRWWATCCCDGGVGVWRCWERAGGRALVLDDSRQRLRACQPVSALHRRWLERRSQWPCHIPAHASVRQRASSLYLAVALACAKTRRCSCRDDGGGMRWNGRPEVATRAAQPPTVSPCATVPWVAASDSVKRRSASAGSTGTAERAPAPAPWARQPKMPLNALISPNLLRSAR